MWAIYKKEIGSFYRSMMGYLYTAFFLLIAGVFFTPLTFKAAWRSSDMCWETP